MKKKSKHKIYHKLIKSISHQVMKTTWHGKWKKWKIIHLKWIR